MKNFGKNLGKRYADIKSNDKKGFSLIELVVVIAIMAILALILVPNLTAFTQRADDSKVQAGLKNVHTAAEMVIQTSPGKDIEKDAADLAKQIAEFANLDADDVEIVKEAGIGTEVYYVVPSNIDEPLKVTFITDRATYTFDGKNEPTKDAK